MILLYILMLASAVDAQNEEISSELEEIKTMLSTVNVRLARVETRQTTSEALIKRVEDKIDDLEVGQLQRHSDSMLRQNNTILLLNELAEKDEGLETRQLAMMPQLNQILDNTDRCCRENISVTCVGPTTAPLPRPQPPTPTTTALQDCKGLTDGVYQLTVGSERIPVFCADGFVMFQRRFTGELNFDRTFSEYEQGFGPASSEHWLGLRYLHLMTKDKQCTFRARLALDDTPWNNDRCGTTYASDCDGQIKEIVGRDFRVSPAYDRYRINVVLDHTDLLHPTVHESFRLMNGQRFTTKDQDNDQHGRNCAAWGDGVLVDGGFWYHSCHPGHPNSVLTTERRFCRSSVCGLWYPYYFNFSLLMFRC